MYSDDQPMGDMPAKQGMEEDPEDNYIEGVDEDGNKILLEVVRYFFYNGEEYVVLGEAQPDSEDEEDESCDRDHGDEEEAINLYIMKVIETEENGEEMEEFVPVEDDDLLEKLVEIVQADFDAEETAED